MPRKHISPHKARAELLAIKLEKARYEIRALRRAEREAEAALALRKSTPEWVELDGQLKQLQLEAELDAMAACVDERRPKIPILNFDLMPGFSPPGKTSAAPKEPAVHPDVIIAAKLREMGELPNINETQTKSPNGKDWKYPSTIDGRRPEDDHRNWK